MFILYGILIFSLMILIALASFHIYKTYFTDADIQFIEEE